jgi:two-component system, chemotaxis family, chemotaxis protein CheY
MTAVLSKAELEAVIRTLAVLVVDDNAHTRKLVRSLLLHIGVKEVFEAADGIAGLEAIRIVAPDVVVLDWELPLLNGTEFVRIVRSPGVFPRPDVPIIMLTAHGQRSRVVEATRLGVNEFLCKPISPKRLYERIVSIFAAPRPFVQLGAYYGPQPRRLLDGEPRIEPTIAGADAGTPLN